MAVEKLRIDRVLSNLGIGTRSEIKKLVKEKRVSVNGIVVKDSGLKCCPESDEITLDGEPIVYSKFVYYMMNKPAGVISATEGRDETVLDLIVDPVKGLFPCGRLDKDTEGLLLIMNDGTLAHELLSPKKKIEKEYFVRLRDPLTDEQIKRIAEGIHYGEDIDFRPGRIQNVTDKECTIIVTEGKFHEVKRMFEAVDNEVLYLKRLRMKNLVLDESLQPGEYRELTEEELADLKEPDHSKIPA